MPSKLFPHCQLPGKVVDFVWNDMRPGGCLAMEPDSRFFERIPPVTTVIARKWYDAKVQADRVFRSPLIGSANQTVDEILNYFSSVSSKVTIYEGFNEVEEFPGQALTGDRLKIYAEWGQYAAEAFHRAGKRFAFGSFSVGNPIDIEGDWLILAQAVKAADALSLHEYGSPTVLSGDGWYTLRYRRVVERLRRLGFTPRILITELGIDRVYEGAYRGWRKAGISAEQYRDQLAAYDTEIQKDDYVLGACIFTCGGNQDWVDFDIDGEGAIADYIRTNTTGPAIWPGVSPSPVPAPAPNSDSRTSPDGNYTIGDGLWFLLTNHNLGKVRWDRSGWDHGEIEVVRTDTGYILWAFKENGWRQYVYHISTDTMRRRSGNHLVTL